MREVVAIIGAVTVFFLAILLWGFVAGFLPTFPQFSVPIPPFQSNPILTNPLVPGSLKTDNIVGLLLALLAALSSYRALAGLGRKRPAGGQGGRSEDSSKTPLPP